MRMAKDDVSVSRLMKDERTGVEKWHVVKGDLDTDDALSVQFLGKDAHRLAYEYAAGVLGKPNCYCFPEWKPVTKIHSAGGVTDFPRMFRSDPSLAAYAKAREAAREMWSGATYAAPPSPWISVKERIPEDSRWVLVSNDLRVVLRAGFVRNIGWVRDNDEPLPHNSVLNVTHWMPLPEPPKE